MPMTARRSSSFRYDTVPKAAGVRSRFPLLTLLLKIIRFHLFQSSRTHCRLEMVVAYPKKAEQNYLGEQIIVSDLTYPGQKNFLMTIVVTIQITMD